MQQFKDCDYIADKLGDLWIVKGYWHNSGILATKVFKRSKHGRFNSFFGCRYKKIILEDCSLHKVPYNEVACYFDPAACFKERGGFLNQPYNNLIREVIETGVPEKNIGIFGSFLLGFDVTKDVDFVIYGIENCKHLKSSLKDIIKKLNLFPISEGHISYQTRKYSKFQNPNFNTFHMLLKNKWSSIQITDKILVTIRFVYKKYEIPKDIFKNKVIKEVKIRGKVMDDLGVNFCPRYFSLKTKKKVYTIGTYSWAYQACVKKDMIIEINGNLREKNCITIDEFDHGIKVL